MARDSASQGTRSDVALFFPGLSQPFRQLQLPPGGNDIDTIVESRVMGNVPNLASTTVAFDLSCIGGLTGLSAGSLLIVGGEC